MDEPDDLIFILDRNRVARMLRVRHNLHVIFPAEIRVQAVHIRPRQHHLTSQHIGKIENIVYELHLVFVDNAALGTLIH
ncbi:hypothetical protein D3C81_1658250 [compost metagenome]